MTPDARHLAAALVLAGLAAPANARAGEDLARVYPATMSWSRQGLVPACTADDVWELKSFKLRFGRELELTCRKATVAFGRHETNVLWAVVFPERPVSIETVHLGDGERATAIFLRFAPAEIARVFPAKTVGKRGSPWLRAEAVRIARHKIGWRWCTPAGNPTILPAGACIVDVDTEEGVRRFYFVDRAAGAMRYVAEFESQPVPAPTPIGKVEALAAFDAVWEAFDREYAGFVLLPDLDWEKLGQRYRKPAGAAGSIHAVAALIADMLSHLEDLHVWVRAGDDLLPGYTRARPLNASWKASRALARATHEGGEDLLWGRTDDGIGYLNVHGLGDQELPAQVDAALERLGDTWALVVDLRFNGGGDERLARQVAARFVDTERVYALNQYRSGPGHADLGEKHERRVAPRGPWRYAAPVVALWGRRTMSSAESMALMFAQCPQVTTMGSASAGSSGNPRRLELDCGITVNLPRWLDMDPDGNPIEHVGVAPEIEVRAAPRDFTDRADPVLERVFEHLREIPERKRAPARG